MIYILLILVGAALAFVFYRTMQSAAQKKKALSLVFLRILIPKKDSDLDEKKEATSQQGGFKEVVSIMEQFLASLHELGKKNAISLEYVSQNGKVHFHMAVPYELQDVIEKQLTSYYPDAVIEIEEERNIFAEKSYQETAILKLKKKPSWPLRTYQQLESDPINNLVNSLTKLSGEDSAMIQVMIRPVADKWQESSKKMAELLYSGKKPESLSWKSMLKDVLKIFSLEKDEKKDEPVRITPQTEEQVKHIDAKAQKVGFDTIIRVVASGADKFSAKSTLDAVVNSFVQFNHPNMNALVKDKKGGLPIVLFDVILRKFGRLWPDKPMILATEEIASIFHFPHSKYNKISNIAWQNFKLAPPPDNLPSEGILLGHVTHRGEVKEVRMPLKDRFRHFYIIGQTGTGKSTILQTMMKQDLRNGNGMCVVDPHGDLVDDILPFIPRERANDVIIFNPADTDRPMGLNMLEAKTDEERELVALDAMNMMIKLFGNEIFGPRIQDYFRNGVLTLMADPEGGALTDIVQLFVNDDFQQKKRKHVTNPIVKTWWDHTFDNMAEREKKEMIPYFAAKFGQFITNATMRNIIGQPNSSFDLGEAMQSKKIILMKLSKGLIGDVNAQLLGMIVVSKIQVAAMRRQLMPKDQRQDFFLYIDEFQNFVTDSIESILSEARKYRLGLILAHQYMDQLEKRDLGGEVKLKGAIFGNVGSVLSYKIGEIDAEFMAKVFAPVFSEQDISNFDKFKAGMKLSIDEQPSRPFTLTVQKAWEMEGYTPDYEAAEAITQLSRLVYGRQKEFIDREIRYRIGAV